MAKTATEIKKEIDGIKKQIEKPGIAAGLKKALESALAGAEAAYDKAVAAEKPSEKKKRIRKPKEKPAEKKEEEEDPNRFVTVFYKGKERTYDLENCDEAKEAMVARKERDKESQAKTKSRLPVTAAAKSAASTADHIIDMIPDKADPAKVMKALQKFEDYWDKAMDSLKEAGISSANIKKLKDAIDAIQEEVKSIKQSK